MWLYRKQDINEGYYYEKFVGHRHCDSGDKMILVCHVILQDHNIKGTSEFMGRSQ